MTFNNLTNVAIFKMTNLYLKMNTWLRMTLFLTNTLYLTTVTLNPQIQPHLTNVSSYSYVYKKQYLEMRLYISQLQIYMRLFISK